MVNVPVVNFDVMQMQWQAEGGPKQAKLEATGNQQELWRLLELLRCPVEIYDQNQLVAWHGWIERVSVPHGEIMVTASLEQMFNRIRPVYSSAGERYTGDWVQDDDSVALFGTKETSINLTDATEAEADNLAATILERTKYAQVEHTFGNRSSVAKIELRGWWDTLEWLLDDTSTGKESYETIGVTLQAFGADSLASKVYQSVALAAAVSWEAGFVQVRMRKEGSPSDTVTVSLCSESGSAPGTVLASGSLDADVISENLNWHRFELDASVPLSYGSTYYLVVERSDAVDADNYYKVDLNSDLGYSRGAFRVWNGSAWVAASTDADMLFIIEGVQETTEQIRSILEDSGQFFSAVEIEDESGVITLTDRDTDVSALRNVSDLLRVGTDDQLQLLAYVDATLRVWVYAEDTTAQYRLGQDLRLTDLYGVPLHFWQLPAGVWVELSDLSYGNVDILGQARVNRIFVEEVTYRVKNDRLDIRPRGAPRLTSLVRI